MKLETRGLDAWDERFNHIDDHFKHELSIANWYPVDKDTPKGLLKASNIHNNGGLYTTLDDSDSERTDAEEAWRMGPRRRRPPPPPPPPLSPQPDPPLDVPSSLTLSHESYIASHSTTSHKQLNSRTRANTAVQRGSETHRKQITRFWFCVSFFKVGKHLVASN